MKSKRSSLPAYNAFKYQLSATSQQPNIVKLPFNHSV